MIKISIIGTTGQAGRINNILQKKKNLEVKCYSQPINIETISNSDAIIIASPTHTHFEYLKKLIKYKGYILVEKPIFSTIKETKKFNKWPEEFKKRIKVNYNLRYSLIAEIIKDTIYEEDPGKPIALHIHTSHGLAHKKDYSESWRAKKSFGVMEMVGVHYINLAMYLFGKIIKTNTQTTKIVKKNRKAPPDTVNINLEMEKGINVNLYHSYAGPKFNKMLLIGTNRYLEYDGEIMKLYSPRDTFDEKGRFTNTPLISKWKMNHEYNWQNSLERSLDHFIKTVKKKGSFKLKELKQATKTMEPIFKTRGKND